MQLSILAALIFSVAQPYIKSKSISGARTIVIIDSSGSMKSTDVYPSRFEAEAKLERIKHLTAQTYRAASGITGELAEKQLNTVESIPELQQAVKYARYYISAFRSGGNGWYSQADTESEKRTSRHRSGMNCYLGWST